MSSTRRPRNAARRYTESAMAVAAILLPLIACTLPVPAASTSTSNSNTATNPTPYPYYSPVVSSGQIVVQTIAQFCDAVHSGNYSQAYTFLSSQYKHTVTRPSQIPNVFSQERILDCAEFGGGGFLQVNGSRATDSVLFTVKLLQLGTETQQSGSINFVQEGTDWKIDALIY